MLPADRQGELWLQTGRRHSRLPAECQRLARSDARRAINPAANLGLLQSYADEEATKVQIDCFSALVEIDTPILTVAVSGAFALVTALGSVWLKHHLDRRREAPRQENDIGLPPLEGSPAAPAPPAASLPLKQSYNFTAHLLRSAMSTEG